jgi:hypothetical protein
VGDGAVEHVLEGEIEVLVLGAQPVAQVAEVCHQVVQGRLVHVARARFAEREDGRFGPLGAALVVRGGDPLLTARGEVAALEADGHVPASSW